MDGYLPLAFTALESGGVSNSVMPKGVEHIVPGAARTAARTGVEFSDAERR